MCTRLKKWEMGEVHRVFHALLRWYKKKKKKLFTVLVWFIVNFARKISLENFDKSRPK